MVNIVAVFSYGLLILFYCECFVPDNNAGHNEILNVDGLFEMIDWLSDDDSGGEGDVVSLSDCHHRIYALCPVHVCEQLRLAM